MQCLEKRPADRPRTADEVLMTLSDAAHLAAAPRPNQSGDIAAVSRLAQRRVLWLVGLALAIVAAGIAVLRITQWGSPDIRSVAVLPLTNLIGPDQEYFVEGMHEALIQELGQVGALKTVISRTSVMRYAATKKSISEIAKELSVDAVVEGSVFRAGDSIRVQLHLIGAVPREHQLWAATFDGEMRNALALQRTVASAIARQIRVGLTAPEQARLTNARTVDPVAYQLYLKGRYLLYPGGEAGLIRIDNTNGPL
jgi:TolB-like protein